LLQIIKKKAPAGMAGPVFQGLAAIWPIGLQATQACGEGRRPAGSAQFFQKRRFSRGELAAMQYVRVTVHSKHSTSAFD